MIDQVARGLLLTGLTGVAVFAAIVYQRIKRHSRRSSILAMAPTLTIWILFEISVLHDWSFTLSLWLSRLGVISLIGTFMHQLWSIDYTEHIEQRMRATIK